jgi:Na+-driven multidrug efflux pump
LSVVINGVLAPFLILGIGFPRFGVAGAAMATFVAVLIADMLMILYFEKKFHYVRFKAAQLWPQMKTWWSMLKIGLPAGAEFVLLFVYITLVYSIIVGFGPAAQAGFGVGVRVMQSLFLPVVALSFAVSPMVGQNFGGRQAQRVWHSVYSGLALATALMLVLAAITWAAPGAMVRVFSKDPNVIAFGRDYLTIVAFNFVAAGIVFTTSSIFWTGQHHPAVIELRLTPDPFCAAGVADFTARSIRHQSHLVHVSRIAGFAGMLQSLAFASRVAQKAEIR